MAQTISPKISVIIIHYNTPQYLKTCLHSILNQSFKNIEVIFIDNASPDERGLEFMREKYGQDPRVKIIANKENLGYSGAANQGIRMAVEGKSPELAAKNIESDWPADSGFVAADYLVITNPDIIYTKNYFELMVEHMDKDKKIAAITGKILKYDFTTDKPTKIIDTVGLFAYRNRRVIDDGQGLIDEGQFAEEKFVFGVSGACPFYRAEALKDVKVMGEYLDGDFFMYKEDVDLSWRFLLYGWKNLFCPNALAYHGRGTGVVPRFKTKDILKNRTKLSRFQKYYSFRNQALMERKNDLWSNFFHDFFPIMLRKIGTLVYMTFFEPYLWKSFFSHLKLFSRMLKKRKIIMQNKKISDVEMGKWFREQSEYLKS